MNPLQVVLSIASPLTAFFLGARSSLWLQERAEATKRRNAARDLSRNGVSLTLTQMDDEGLEERLVDHLDALIPHLKYRLAGCNLPDELVEAAGACFSFLRVMLSHAAIVRDTSDKENAEAATANVRAMLEAYAEIYHILQQPDINAAGVRNIIFALLELRDFMTISPVADFTEDLKHIERKLDHYRSRFNDVVSEVEKLRNPDKGKGQIYASGGRTKLVDATGEDLEDPESPARLYRVLCWDAHHVVTTALDLTIEYGPDAINFSTHSRIDFTTQGMLNRHAATMLLVRSWSLMRKKLRITEPNT